MDSYAHYYGHLSDSSEATSRGSRRDRCGVDGCRKKQCYCTLPGRAGTRIYSKYCELHTCEAFLLEDSDHCSHPRVTGQRYCQSHLKCGQPGCAELGEFASERGEYVQWFCAAHRCTVARCRARARDSQQQRCNTHTITCNISGCDRPCHLDRDGSLLLTCAVHYGTFKCEWPGCVRRRPGYHFRYCLAHKCSLAQCGNARDPAGGGPICVLHRCKISPCQNQVSDPSQPSSRTCPSHTCKSPRCLSARRSPGDDFCPSHACVVAGCLEPRSSSSTGSGRCVEHELRRARRDRAASWASSAARSGGGGSFDFEALRERFDRERKRRSDDPEGLRRLQKEREREIERIEKELEMLERERGRGEGYGSYPGWERWYER
ncbi:hypothetical protein N656DRAFT_801068 [Canariomyces notabilis]|uniref:Uncharacterized protein n=1 Tax=Canariomyces notabilis TaxID=2074819 RepID=A0AAN6QFH0_9PEZI|nr:hypothetical protein N656DRAFT_801068 [Canariomyces arenarius]